MAFDAAVLESRDRPRPWHRALIAERAGRFHLAHGLEAGARSLLATARDHYRAWGAAAKVSLLEREFPHLRPGAAAGAPPAPATSSNSVSAEAVDLMGVLRASQALSSETSLLRLAASVGEVLASLSGATRVLVLSCQDEQWLLLAPAPGEPAIPVAEAGTRGLLPLSAFAYAERTREPLVVDDAIADDRFARDPYFAGIAACSLLVAPIGGQSTGRAMVILENRAGRAAFNGQRLDAVMLIAGQLAVSLANAQLYENLEQRVQARTRELAQTQAQLVATARSAGKAEIANNVLHNVGNVLNSINVSASVVRRTLSDSRVHGLRRAAALMRDQGDDLARFLTNDPRGRALPGYFDRLAEALEAERTQALGDLDRLVRSVDHISHVVARQQSLAGPSSLLETARPDELVEEALRMCADPLAQAGASVVRRYAEVPAAALDKPRLLQILVNLIGNAAQAMHSVAPASRLLTVETSLVSHDGGDRLRMTVTDAGEGIDANHLPHLFAHGFTTRRNGHGFGLHSSAMAAVEMGGKLSVHSDGPGTGATFTLDVPIPLPYPPVAAAVPAPGLGTFRKGDAGFS